MGSDKKRQSCFNCTKRRIKCDQSEPHCNKCLHRGLTCTGYGIRYRFAEGKAAPTPGPEAARRLGEPGRFEGSKPRGAQTRRQNNLRWVNVSNHSKKGGANQLAASNDNGDGTVTASSLNQYLDHQDGTDYTEIEKGERQHPAQSSNFDAFHLTPISMMSLRPLLSNTDPRTRLLFNHFDRHVSPVMLMYDDEANGYRHQILPLAHGDPVVERAVCISAAFHLSQRTMPELRLPAEIGRAAIISKLSQTAASDLSDSTWATIILLVVADLVTGHEQVMTLCKMLAAFMEVRREHSSISTPLGNFLYSQSRLISFFAHPMLGESEAIADFSRVLCGPVDAGVKVRQEQLQLFATSPTANSLPTIVQTHFYVNMFHQATEIYLLRARAAFLSDLLLNDVDAFQMPARVRHMRSLFERVAPDAAGAHTLVWPGFVTAAEAREEDDRQYFAAILERIWEMTGYANVRRGLDALPGIWARQGSQQRWTAALPELKTIVM